jgi:peptidoglycan/xylan/chitin deacetylase (PgdA/CDA1 family)
MTTTPVSNRVWLARGALLVLALAALVVFGLLGQAPPAPALAPLRLALLVPDDLDLADRHVQAWRDAAAELGFPMSVLRASELLRAGTSAQDAALVVPDQVHRRMNDALVAALEARVRGGARLLLVQDAGVQDMDGSYHPQQSRLSRLAGIPYALYGELRGRMSGQNVAWVEGAAVPLLRLPPGKLIRDGESEPLNSTQAAPLDDEPLAVVGYHYGRLTYPVFTTRGTFAGRRLMHAQEGSLLAGLHTLGLGQVLFVNLPLTYLKLRTDGLLLHSFLRYFAQDVAGLPQLAQVPDARGAMIMNWHVDSAAAVPAIERLESLGAFEQGPYSIHLTAGPDVDQVGDGLGMDLARNPAMQQWVRRFVARGDEVGSHGGWIHNAFGRSVGLQPPQRARALIERNVAAVQAASGQPVREYSAPLGHHPGWKTPWLHEHGIGAYYFTGDIGMAPTRSYQDGRRSQDGMWAFPVLSYGAHASFEETWTAGIAQSDIGAWLKDVADYCVQFRTVRMVYFHPPGVALFPNAFRDWLQHTGALVRAGDLRWITMAQYTAFANARLAVEWDVQADAHDASAQLLQARHPHTLEHFAWLLPTRRYAQPRVLQGRAVVTRDGDDWRVVAGDTSLLRLQLPQRLDLPPPFPSPASPTAP